MAYQLFYGGPTPGMGGDIFEGAQRQETFSRRVTAAQLELQQRQQSMEATRLALQKRQEERRQEEWERTHELTLTREDRLTRAEERQWERLEAGQRQALTEQRNQLRMMGFRKAASRDELRRGEIWQEDLLGQGWAGRPPQPQLETHSVSQQERMDTMFGAPLYEGQEYDPSSSTIMHDRHGRPRLVPRTGTPEDLDRRRETTLINLKTDGNIDRALELVNQWERDEAHPMDGKMAAQWRSRLTKRIESRSEAEGEEAVSRERNAIDAISVRLRADQELSMAQLEGLREETVSLLDDIHESNLGNVNSLLAQIDQRRRELEAEEDTAIGQRRRWANEEIKAMAQAGLIKNRIFEDGRDVTEQHYRERAEKLGTVGGPRRRGPLRGRMTDKDRQELLDELTDEWNADQRVWHNLRESVDEWIKRNPNASRRELREFIQQENSRITGGGQAAVFRTRAMENLLAGMEGIA